MRNFSSGHRRLSHGSNCFDSLNQLEQGLSAPEVPRGDRCAVRVPKDCHLCGHRVPCRLHCRILRRVRNDTLCIHLGRDRRRNDTPLPADHRPLAAPSRPRLSHKLGCLDSTGPVAMHAIISLSVIPKVVFSSASERLLMAQSRLQCRSGQTH